MYVWLAVVALLVPAIIYSQRAGQKAVDEGRAKATFGMVSNVTAYTELHRRARSGDRTAQLFIWLQYLAFPVGALLFVWPTAQ